MTGLPDITATLTRLFPEGTPDRMGVAVSGGGDSMALLVLLDRWAREHGADLAAVSVDHGLRPEAGEEIALARELCQSLGWSHETVTWQWSGQGNVQDAARRARRGLIGTWARSEGLHAVALGHTADDQAETVLMRLARGSGVDGLAGMAECRQVEGTVWVRPLLGLRRQALRDLLATRKIRWADDPSNEDTRFDRVRARQAFAHLAPLGLSVERLSRTADHMRRASEALHQGMVDLAERVARREAGDLLITRQELLAAPEELATRLFAAALQWVSGSEYRPRYDALRTTLGSDVRQTLHGCLVSPSPDAIRLSRELAPLKDSAVPAGAVWDQRWLVTGPIPENASVSALGEDGLAQCPGWRDVGLPRDSLLVSPALWQGDQLLAAPLAQPESEFQAELLPEKASFRDWLRAHANYRIEHARGMSI